MNETTRPKLAEAGKSVAPPKPIDLIRRDLDRMGNEFLMALPQHIPVDRFKRIVLTAINQNQDLMGADRRSLMGACMKAAQDGLYPDGREGALVIFNTKVKGEGGKESWVKAVQWMPMVYGIIKKMRNSGELASIVAHEVYARDTFHYTLGDDEHIEHKPYMGDEDSGKMIAVYSIAKLKDGTVQREVLNRKAVEKIRNVSKSKDGPAWTNWYEEMARKCAVRRLSKYLPMSTEVEEMLRRDDAISASADVMKLNNADGVTIEGEASTEVSNEEAEEAQREAEDREQSEQESETQEGDPGPSDRAADSKPATDHDPETGEVKQAAKPATTAKKELF